MHNAQITRNNPALITLLVDRSGSMADLINYEGDMIPKSEVVTRIINSLIDELMYRCRKGADHQNYFDIAIFGYNNNSVYSLLDYISSTKKIFSVADLAAADVQQRTTVKRRVDNKGEYFAFTSTTNLWTEGHSGGNTPTYTALKSVYLEMSNWIKSRNSLDSFPPILIHISDGEPSDCTDDMLLSVSQKIKSLETNDGNVLFLNIHLASYDGDSVLFPSSKTEIEKAHKNAELLYNMSSDMPFHFYEDISAIKGVKISCKDTLIKGVVYNASVVELVKVLSVGTSTIR